MPPSGRPATSALARLLARDLLSQFDHEPVGVVDVEGAVPPRPVDGTGEDFDAQAAEPFGLSIDVVDEEQHLAGRPGPGRIASDQPGQPQALIESELRARRGELGVAALLELEWEPEHVSVERERSIQIADIKDDVVDRVHDGI
jgi:hypothetical protein